MTRLIDWMWRALFYLGIQAWDRFGKRVPVREALTGPSAEESERPAMVPHKVDPVTPDRPLAFIVTLDFSKLRLDPDIDALCKEIEAGA